MRERDGNCAIATPPWPASAATSSGGGVSLGGVIALSKRYERGSSDYHESSEGQVGRE